MPGLRTHQILKIRSRQWNFQPFAEPSRDLENSFQQILTGRPKSSDSRLKVTAELSRRIARKTIQKIHQLTESQEGVAATSIAISYLIDERDGHYSKHAPGLRLHVSDATRGSNLDLPRIPVWQSSRFRHRPQYRPRPDR